MNTRCSILIVALLASAQAAGANPLHSALDPVPRGDQWWKDRHEAMNRRVAELGEKAQLIFIGDSITQGWEGEGKEVWARYYAHRHAINLGIGGDRTQHVLWRLDNGNLTGLKPKAAVVMIGTNNSNGEDNTPGQIVEGVTAIVKKLRAKLPETKVLLLAIFPRGENFSVQRGKLAMINQVLRRVADAQHVVWIDFSHRFLNDDGTLPRQLMPDYLHLSPKGYAIWAEALEDQLAQILGDERVKPVATAGADLSGEWTWTMDTPNGPVSAALVLRQDGEKVTGKFARDDRRWLEIENGKVTGNAFTWIVKRDRPDGSILTYRMSGRVEGDKIFAQATTALDGAEVTSEWSAQRNQVRPP